MAQPRPRSDLHEILKGVLESDNVYFQPPPNVKMSYPAIVYHREDVKTFFGSNRKYLRFKRYQVTVIDEDPDSPIPDRLAELPLCEFDRWYAADQLNHDVFRIFF